jgi:hypothetical protein
MIDPLADLLVFDVVGDEFRADALAPRYPTLEECSADPRLVTPVLDPRTFGPVTGCYSISMAVLVAASTVEPALVPASSHASFLRTGKATEPVEIRVDRSHDSRRFARRRVSFSQHETFCVCDVSFQRTARATGACTTIRWSDSSQTTGPVPARKRSRWCLDTRSRFHTSGILTLVARSDNLVMPPGAHIVRTTGVWNSASYLPRFSGVGTPILELSRPAPRVRARSRQGRDRCPWWMYPRRR